jgi:ubiquinone/menaquinone biosynthesis C-methylase UbiE
VFSGGDSFKSETTKVAEPAEKDGMCRQQLFAMSSVQSSKTSWGNAHRLVASEKWKAKSAAMGRDATEALVDYARPQPGMKILDLASGTGEPAITLASRIGPEGHVTALDLSPELLQMAEERARERGLTNITTHQADANKLPFADHSFDLVTSRCGVMFLREDALREAGRVLRPGARACFLAWGPFEQPFWANTMGIVHKHAGGTLVPADQDPFKYSQPGSLSSALRKAGFEKVEEESRTLPWVWPGTADELWEQARAVAAPFRALLERVPAEKWDEINSEVHAAIGKCVVGGQVKFGAVMVLASGSGS